MVSGLDPFACRPLDPSLSIIFEATGGELVGSRTAEACWGLNVGLAPAATLAQLGPCSAGLELEKGFRPKKFAIFLAYLGGLRDWTSFNACLAGDDSLRCCVP